MNAHYSLLDHDSLKLVLDVLTLILDEDYPTRLVPSSSIVKFVSNTLLPKVAIYAEQS
jgi:hypothetical protein